MEEKERTPLVLVLAIIGIIAFFCIFIFLTIRAFKNANGEEEENTVTPVITQEVTVTPAAQQQTSEYDQFFYILYTDVANMLKCDNTKYYELQTPGLSKSDVEPIRLALGQSDAEIYFMWKADNQLSAKFPTGEYLMEINVHTKSDNKKVYLYFYTETSMDGTLKVSALTYDIGDF